MKRLVAFILMISLMAKPIAVIRKGEDIHAEELRKQEQRQKDLAKYKDLRELQTKILEDKNKPPKDKITETLTKSNITDFSIAPDDARIGLVID